MLKRDISLSRPAVTISEEFKLTAGDDKQARFNNWRAEKLSKPQSCAKHPQIQLVYVRGESGVHQVYDLYLPSGPGVRQGVVEFRAALRCPACCCAYALCPPEFHTTSFETFDTTTPERAHVLARCREFADQVNQHGCGFVQIVGGPGSGKTLLASNIVGALENGDALYVRQGQLTTALRASYGRKDVVLWRKQQVDRDDWNDDETDDGAPPTPLEIVQGVRFLVLDEVGCSPLANDERLMLDELIKHRYDERKPTVLISNLPLDQLKDFFGDALAERIKHASGNGKFMLQFEGGSYRRSSGENYLEGLR